MSNRSGIRRFLQQAILIGAWVTFPGCGRALPPSTADRSSAVEQLSWLVGCWSMTRPGGLVVSESWTRATPDTLMGMGRTERSGAVVSSEVMRIFVRADSIVYAALPSGQTYTEFRAGRVADTTITFENPAHDFPQRITYTAVGRDSLIARIEGEAQGRTRRVSFDMARVTCADR